MCLSEKTADELFINIEGNVERYRNEGFEDLATGYGWSVELQMTADLEALKDLDGGKGQENEVNNALLVWHALKDLTPSLACENRVWSRLTHVEGFNYSRERWLKTSSDLEVIKSVKDHFFADTRTKWRDDNAISRLWWIAYIASLVSPIDHKTALEFMLGKADIRLNFVERARISSRPKLSAGIIRGMMNDEWITNKEDNFRRFMRQINKYGGGVLFEARNDDQVDEFIEYCIMKAK